MGPVPGNPRLALALLACACAPALACEVPDEGGNTPWRRAVAKIRYLPDIETWAQRMAQERAVVKYVLSLDQPKRVGGRCWWPVEVRAQGRTWRRFLVTPDGKAWIEDSAGY
ncbi:MAG: hypothetical protein IT513_08525 [Burkholderiales bacterium]|nr:hypothetical protein [Burkholderiales bacterium]